MSGPNSISSRGVLDATPYLEDTDTPSVDAPKAAAARATTPEGPTAEQAKGLIGSERDAAEALGQATGQRKTRGGRGGYGAASEAAGKGMTVAQLQAQRHRPAEPKLPITLKDFVSRFADPTNTPDVLMDSGGIRSDLSYAFRHASNDGQLHDTGVALDHDKTLRRELYSALEARGDLTGDQMDEIVGLAVEQIEVSFASSVSAEITKVVESQCDSALALLKVVDRNSDTRRACLSEIAASCKTVEDAAQALEGLGVPVDDSHGIAELLLEHAGTPEARSALRSGESGEVVGYVFTEGAFDHIEGLFDNALDSSRSDIKQLRRDATSQRFDHEALLYSPKYAVARGVVLTREGIGGRDGKTSALEEITDGHAGDKYKEEIAITCLNTSFALIPGGQITFMGRLSAGAAMGLMGNAPGLSVAQLEVHTASAAVTTGLGSKKGLSDAKFSRNVAAAAALTQAVIGCVGSTGGDVAEAVTIGGFSTTAYELGPAALGMVQDGVVNLAAFELTH